MTVKCNGANDYQKKNRDLQKRACIWHCLVLAVQQTAYLAMEVAVLWRRDARLGDHPLPSQGGSEREVPPATSLTVLMADEEDNLSLCYGNHGRGALESLRKVISHFKSC